MSSERQLAETGNAGWAYLSDNLNPYEVYDFTPTRERASPEPFLAGFEGCLQADAYSCYEGIHLKSKGAIQDLACRAHTLRSWHQARDTDSQRSHHVLEFICRLYEIEERARTTIPTSVWLSGSNTRRRCCVI